MATFFGPWDLGKLIGDVFGLYKKNWLYYIATVVPFMIVIALIEWGLGVAAGGTAWLPGVWVPGIWTFWNLFVALGFFLLGALISVIINALMHNTMINLVGQQYFADKLSIGQSFNAAVKRLVPVLLAGLLRVIILVALAITIIGIPFAIYFMVKWLFVTHVILFEGKSPTESLSRSSELVKDNWWRVVAYVIIVAIIAAIISGLIGLIPYVGTAIGSIIAAPITIISSTLIYFTLRVEKEHYNISQMKTDLEAWDALKKPAYTSESSPAGYCPYCGAVRTAGAKYCTSCGKEYDSSSKREVPPDTDIEKKGDTPTSK